MINVFPRIQAYANDKHVSTKLIAKQSMHNLVHPAKQARTCRSLEFFRGKKQQPTPRTQRHVSSSRASDVPKKGLVAATCKAEHHVERKIAFEAGSQKNQTDSILTAATCQKGFFLGSAKLSWSYEWALHLYSANFYKALTKTASDYDWNWTLARLGYTCKRSIDHWYWWVSIQVKKLTLYICLLAVCDWATN